MSDAPTPTQVEPVAQPEWSAYLERRVMRLLLAHDRGAFRKQFTFLRTESDLKEHPLLRQYDRFLQVILLGDELLDDILPRIRRQLSLHTDHERRREEAPTQGDIDWRRTLDRSLREMPGQPPVDFDTRLRQRSTATPENIMVVAILQHFGKALREVQQTTLLDHPLTEPEQQTIHSLLERLERELAAPYAQRLFEQAQAADLELLTEQVEQRLAPGTNPYRDVIEWWQRFTKLTFGRAETQAQDAYARRRSEEKAVAWLYEFWIALEFLHLLSADSQAALAPTEQPNNSDSLLEWSFTWHAQRWRFRYNRQLHNERWLHAPATRPDYLIEREQPHEVRHGDQLIWRESGILLDAKYYLVSDQEQPIKKMLGEMTLLDAAQAYLFFPQLPEHPRTITYNQALYPGRNAAIQVQLYQLAPDGNVAELHTHLKHILDACIQHVAQPEPIACHGVVFDRDSVNEYGRSPEQVRIFCPKPHIGRNVFDIVEPSDCLNNPNVCHVIGQAMTPPYVSRVASEADLTTAVEQLRKSLQAFELQDDSEHAELKRKQLIQSIGQLIENFVKLSGADTKQYEHFFKDYIFPNVWEDLHPDVRNMLISGEYVRIRLRDVSSSLKDWAIAAVQFVRALEYEMDRRFRAPCGTKLKRGGRNIENLMFGTPGFIVRNKSTHHEAKSNWQLVQQYVINPAKIDEPSFEKLFLEIDKLTKQRNAVAHTDTISYQNAQDIHTSIVGNADQPGLLIQLVRMLKAPPSA